MSARWTLLALLLASPALVVGTAQPETDNSVVRTIDVNGLALPRPTVNTRPELLEIASVEQLAKVAPIEEAQRMIASKVDFTKEQLIYFAWNGAPDSKVTFRAEQSEQGTAITFTYDWGFSMRLQDQHVLFAVPRSTRSKLVIK